MTRDETLHREHLKGRSLRDLGKEHDMTAEGIRLAISPSTTSKRVRVYLDRHGRYRGASTGLGGLWLLLWLRVAWIFCIGACLLAIALPCLLLAGILAGLREITHGPTRDQLHAGAVALFAVAAGCVRLIERL